MTNDFIPSSELILNADGSIYHLCLKPGELAETIITVGDPERVQQVSRHFSSIELKRSNREFALD
jgi:uridine phosphorylase